MRDVIKHDALLSLVVFTTALIGAFRSWLFHSVICSLGGPLSHSSPVVFFLSFFVFFVFVFVFFLSWASTLLEFLFHYPC